MMVGSKILFQEVFDSEFKIEVLKKIILFYEHRLIDDLVACQQ